MNTIPADTYKYTQRLWKVLKTNYNEELANRVVHELFDNNNFGILEDENIDITHEFEKYRVERAKAEIYKITQLTLPHRFGMYKSLQNNARFMNIELEEPGTDEPSGRPKDEKHKVRPIF